MEKPLDSFFSNPFPSRSTYSHVSFSSCYQKRFYFLSISCKKCQDGSPFFCSTGLLYKIAFVLLTNSSSYKKKSRTHFFIILNIYYLKACVRCILRIFESHPKQVMKTESLAQCVRINQVTVTETNDEINPSSQNESCGFNREWRSQKTTGTLQSRFVLKTSCMKLLFTQL